VPTVPKNVDKPNIYPILVLVATESEEIMVEKEYHCLDMKHSLHRNVHEIHDLGCDNIVVSLLFCCHLMNDI
jgi:hypothetical protein